MIIKIEITANHNLFKLQELKKNLIRYVQSKCRQYNVEVKFYRV